MLSISQPNLWTIHGIRHPIMPQSSPCLTTTFRWDSGVVRDRCTAMRTGISAAIARVRLSCKINWLLWVLNDRVFSQVWIATFCRRIPHPVAARVALHQPDIASTAHRRSARPPLAPSTWSARPPSATSRPPPRFSALWCQCSDPHAALSYGKPFGFLFIVSRYRKLCSDIGNSNSRYREIIPDIGKWFPDIGNSNFGYREIWN